MPTSLSEWASLLVGGIAAGVVSGAFARRVPMLLIVAALVQIVAAPLIYYMPPMLEHRSLAEYQAWGLIAIPMLAVQSFVITVVVALLIFYLKR